MGHEHTFLQGAQRTVSTPHLQPCAQHSTAKTLRTVLCLARGVGLCRGFPAWSPQHSSSPPSRPCRQFALQWSSPWSPSSKNRPSMTIQTKRPKKDPPAEHKQLVLRTHGWAQEKAGVQDCQATWLSVPQAPRPPQQASREDKYEDRTIYKTLLFSIHTLRPFVFSHCFIPRELASGDTCCTVYSDSTWSTQGPLRPGTLMSTARHRIQRGRALWGLEAGVWSSSPPIHSPQAEEEQGSAVRLPWGKVLRS